MRAFVQWITLAFLAMAALGGCGDSGSSATPTATGVFADAPVQGVRYVFGNYSGYTGAGGTFSYPVGVRGTFRVGDIVLGTATGSPLVTVVDLVKARHPEYTDQQAQSAALNIVRFLTSIGGIYTQDLLEIQKVVFDAAKGSDFGAIDLLGLSDQELQTIIGRLGTFDHITTSQEAQEHLESTLANVGRLPHVGVYIAEDWNGAAFIEVFVSPDGTLYGYGTNAKGAAYDLRGSVLPTGEVSFETRDRYLRKTVGKTVMASLPSTVSSSTGTSDGKGIITGTVLEKGPFSEKTFPFVLRRIANPLDGFVGLYRGWFSDEYEVAYFTFGVNADGKVVGWAGASTNAAPLSGKVDVRTGKFSLPCGNGVMTGTLSGMGDEGTYSGPADVKFVFTGDRLYMGSRE